MARRCIAITKLGLQCAKNSSNPNVTSLCGTHLRSLPINVIVNNVITPYNEYINNHNNNNNNILNNRNNDIIADNRNHGNHGNHGNHVNNRAKGKKGNKMNVSIEIEKPIEQIIEELEKFTQINECHCCLDNEFQHYELIQCTKADYKNAHLVCSGCLARHMRIQIESETASMKCMFDSSDKCGGEYIIDQVRNILSEEENIKLTECLEMQTLLELANICENYQICPFCKKFGCIVETLPEYPIIYLQCGRCNELWCSKCKKKAHGQDVCYKFKFPMEMSEKDKISDINKMIQDISSEKLTHACTKCNTKYIKEEGCNLMTCEKCHALSCYICRATLTIDKFGNKYGHFKGHERSYPDATCQLWNNYAGDGKEKQGNTEFNMSCIFSELGNIIRVNESLYIKKLIYNCIFENFKKEEPKAVIKRELLKIGYNNKLLDIDKLSIEDKRILLLIK
jgi:hypothetical protein